MLFAAIRNDPEDVDERPRTDLMSRKDLRNLSLAAIVFILLLMPVYGVLKRGRDKHLCIENIKAIGQALQLYAIDNTDRLPPVYATDTGNEPSLYGGYPLTWMTVISDRMSKNTNFLCPSAEESERVKGVAVGANARKGPMESAYGMYGALSAMPRSFISSTTEAILVAETSNGGSKNTYDPLPFKDAAGRVSPYDGFMIGLDNTNFTPAEEETRSATLLKSQFATRLAFYESEGGDFFGKKVIPRHDGGIHALNADLGLVILKPPAAKLQRASTDLIGHWEAR